MKTYVVRLEPGAREDLRAIGDWITDAVSFALAEAYVDLLRAHLAGFNIAPARGTRLRDGRRQVGFERRVTILFRIRGDAGLIERVFARGRRSPTE